jgi:hypothetical protein
MIAGSSHGCHGRESVFVFSASLWPVLRATPRRSKGTSVRAISRIQLRRFYVGDQPLRYLQRWGVPGAQRWPAWQSKLVRHFFPTPHGAQNEPPQSISVSVASMLLSKHGLLMQVRVTGSQAWLLQSPVSRHRFPSGQPPQLPPPQSVSVSRPSCRWSWHCAATHVCDTESHA